MWVPWREGIGCIHWFNDETVVCVIWCRRWPHKLRNLFQLSISPYLLGVLWSMAITILPGELWSLDNICNPLGSLLSNFQWRWMVGGGAARRKLDAKCEVLGHVSQNITMRERGIWAHFMPWKPTGLPWASFPQPHILNTKANVLLHLVLAYIFSGPLDGSRPEIWPYKCAGLTIHKNKIKKVLG